MVCLLPRRGCLKRVGIYLGSHPHSGGAFQYSSAMLETAAALPERDFDVCVVYTEPAWGALVSDSGARAECVAYGAVHTVFDRMVRHLPEGDRAWRALTTAVSPLAAALRRELDRIWIFPAQDTLSYQVAVPSLVTVYDLMHRYESRFPEVAAGGRARRRDDHYRRIARSSRGILVDSQVGREQFVESYGVSGDRVFVMPPAIPPHIARAVGTPVGVLPFDLPDKFLFYPAQFWAHKNHGRLLDALALCLKNAPDVTLVLSGSPKNAYAEVRAKVARDGLERNVVFLGFVHDEHMPDVYKRARALVMPTFFGPTNIPPLEAMALGCPVACSNIYAMPEQVDDAALLFDPRSVGEIASAMLRLWTDDGLCSRLAALGRARSAHWNLSSRVACLAEIVSHVDGA